MKYLLITIAIVCTFSTPIAVFHGMGDACANAGMKQFTNELGQKTTSTSVCIEIGNGGATSILSSFNSQADKACQAIQAHPDLQGDFNVVGLSQGALLARYIIESCQVKGRVKKWLSIGGPNMGVDAMPRCSSKICWPLNFITKSLVYTDTIQNSIGPAGYFRDPANLDTYVSKSVFLNFLNNEVRDNADNETRSKNFQNLDAVMLVMFSEDHMVYPKESEWFQTLDSKGNLLNLEDSDFYKQDYIGVKTLNEAGKIKFVSIKGDHLRFQESDIENTFVPFLTD